MNFTKNSALWTYEQFLAFVWMYTAETNYHLTELEIDFIKQNTGIEDIAPIQSLLDSVSDSEAIDLIAAYKTAHLSNPEAEAKARKDVEALLGSKGEHPQIERAALHILERIL